LQGDANTRFFHSVANGRRRKCAIFTLETDEGDITEGKICANILKDIIKIVLEEKRGIQLG
jgi:hypothetical protein